MRNALGFRPWQSIVPKSTFQGGTLRHPNRNPAKTEPALARSHRCHRQRNTLQLTCLDSDCPKPWGMLGIEHGDFRPLNRELVQVGVFL